MPNPQEITFIEVFSDPPNPEVEPIEYFYKFFTKDMIIQIVEQTNLYALQSLSNFVTNGNEIEQYCGMLLKMGIVIMPRYNMYWWNEFKFAPVADVMSRDKFKEITRYIHFNDNSQIEVNRDNPNYDRLYKVRPILEKLRSQCLLLEPEEKQSIDEQLIPFKGKINAKLSTKKNQKNGVSKYSLDVE